MNLAVMQPEDFLREEDPEPALVRDRAVRRLRQDPLQLQVPCPLAGERSAVRSAPSPVVRTCSVSSRRPWSRRFSPTVVISARRAKPTRSRATVSGTGSGPTSTIKSSASPTSCARSRTSTADGSASCSVCIRGRLRLRFSRLVHVRPHRRQDRRGQDLAGLELAQDRERNEPVAHLVAEREPDFPQEAAPIGPFPHRRVVHLRARLLPKGPDPAGFGHETGTGPEGLPGIGRDPARLAVVADLADRRSRTARGDRAGRLSRPSTRVRGQVFRAQAGLLGPGTRRRVNSADLPRKCRTSRAKAIARERSASS